MVTMELLFPVTEFFLYMTSTLPPFFAGVNGRVAGKKILCIGQDIVHKTGKDEAYTFMSITPRCCGENGHIFPKRLDELDDGVICHITNNDIRIGLGK